MPGAEVRKKERFTLKQAKTFRPKVTKPEEIDDVVFQLGINDFNHGFSGTEIAEKFFDIQKQYKKQFPNARQHITAIPPLSKDHEQVNKRLQKQCSQLGCNFISTKSFLDHATGRFRIKLIKSDRLHYSDIGIRHLAKEIKKSLFSLSNRESDQLSHVSSMRKDNPTQ